MNFYYDEEAIRCLKAKDPILADIIDRIGPIERPIDADLFSALINNIVGQQISMKAQETVWKRMLAAFGAITPENICRASVEEIQQCGLSTRKATYIREAAEKVLSGACDLEALKDMPAKRKATADDLWRYAKMCRVANVMRPYLEATE